MRGSSSLLGLLLSFSLILLSTFLVASPTATPSHHRHRHHHHNSNSKRRRKQQPPPPPPPPHKPSSWELFKSLLTCKHIEQAHVHDPTARRTRAYPAAAVVAAASSKYSYAKLASCSSLCALADVVDHAGTRVVHRSDSSPETSVSGHHEFTPLVNPAKGHSSLSSTASSAPRGLPLRRLSGCYECRLVVDPSRCPISRPSICSCPDCGEVFLRPDSLEAHQAVRHAVSELGPDDSGRNIVEIIFQSSWLKKKSPVCHVDRILKVRNTQRTISRFESYRESVKSRASRRNPRCVADGNELLRFYCTTFACSIGTRGSTSLCGAGLLCGVCSTIRNGFGHKMDDGRGLCTTASSGRAHDCMSATEEEKAASRGRRAMLVCRVIAGKVRMGGSSKVADPEDNEEQEEWGGESVGERYDSVAGMAGLYSNLDELYVFNSKAILPCFVVIYRVEE
ncbi:hypothetical protein EJ110_NYTH04609 [Nymphaea thermarum]|nr:hypothetical protein EJ110_NYTH04609 [Nymphaea thermarum]